VGVASDELVADACAVLGAVDRGPVGAVGGQKAVRLIERDGVSRVLKVIAVTASSPTILTRVEREVQLLRSLNNAHVVRVTSDLVTIGTPVRGAAWTEELLDGSDLTPLLGPQWSWADTWRMLRDVADGLAAAHALGVVHRDLSSNNVRRLDSGDYKVLDFSFARHTLRSGVTQAGQPGTLNFLSPEHLNAYTGVPMPASDVFCLGILAYTALTGMNPIPFAGDEDEYFRRLQSARLVADIADVRPDLRADQHDLLRRMLHAQPARRYLNGSRLALALEGVA